MNKTFLFQLNHPAHYHLFKNLIESLRESGHEVHISIKDKDILKDLLIGEAYSLISSNYRKKNLLSIIKSVISRDFKLYKLVKKLNPDLMIGTSPEIGHIRKFVKTPAIFFGEDDVTISKAMFLGALTCYPFFDCILSPKGCNNSCWNSKTFAYQGFQKLAYLHPNLFKPDRKKVLIPVSERFFILRFANLKAYHDMNALGIDNKIASKIIKLLEGFGHVLISSERILPSEFEKYRFKGNLNDIHHYLYYSDLNIGDSQSMTMESAMLGTPSIRFNDFVGKISVLEELEHKYSLTFGIKSSETEKLFAKIEELLSTPHLKEEFQHRRQKMLAEKIDVTAFMSWFIENYPDSSNIMRENPDYQYNFK
jgi:predicted glycosyltransferase